ncbi:MAG TPA: MBL fold metallo-hydrolase [Bacteroidales bacterium]|nr:MBL fold metallo-hydrolase [Bacteroidales bacterium]
MIRIQRFAFNPFQVNTYVLSDETRACVIIDPGCSDGVELLELENYIKEQSLKPERVLLTHTHIDHVIGCNAVEERLGLGPEGHRAGMVFLDHSMQTAATYGLDLDRNPELSGYLEEGKDIEFGNSRLEVLYTPGHADGSVCFLSRTDGFVIVGDVLFQMSIGRTDFPTGDFDLLKKNIFEKLFVLPDETIVYPGHGPETTIGFEKNNNPFLGVDNFMH